MSLYVMARIFTYGVLGWLLAIGGINVADKTLLFSSILGCVILIDYFSTLLTSARSPRKS